MEKYREKARQLLRQAETANDNRSVGEGPVSVVFNGPVNAPVTVICGNGIRVDAVDSFYTGTGPASRAGLERRRSALADLPPFKP